MKNTNDIVIHHNYLNESIFNFNELELNLFIVIVYKLRNFFNNSEVSEIEGEIKENLLESVVFSAKDIKSLMQMKDRSFKAFEKVIHALQDRTISIKTPKGYRRIKAFPTLEFDNENKTVEIDINPKIVPLFMELTEQFTQYSLKEFLTLNSKYSKRLFQLLKQYENVGERTISVEDLKKFLEVSGNKSYARFYNFEKRVLETTKNDINNCTAMTVEYEKERNGKDVIAITFKLKRKKEIEELPRKETRQEIIKRYLKYYEVKNIKDLTEANKKFLDVALVGQGYKATIKTRGDSNENN